MKRYGNVFPRILYFGTLYKAYNNARRGRRYKSEILLFGYCLEKNLLELQKELRKKSYKHGNYRNFVVYDAKKREIKAASFKDRVIHKAVHDTIEPLFDRSFIYDSYACRKNKGIYKAINRLELFLCNPSNKYYLQCDISKYFKSIDHEVLLFLVEKKIKDSNALWLIGKIVDITNNGEEAVYTVDFNGEKRDVFFEDEIKVIKQIEEGIEPQRALNDKIEVEVESLQPKDIYLASVTGLKSEEVELEKEFEKVLKERTKELMKALDQYKNGQLEKIQ